MMRAVAARHCQLLAAALLIVASAKAAPTPPAEPAGSDALPPAPREALWPRAPTPNWDVGLTAGVCGVGQTSVWQGTEFCGALLADVLWLRHTRQHVGLGAFAAASTAGFYDFRPSIGLSLHVPTSQLLSLGLRAGPLLHVMGDAALPGFTVQTEFGVRAHNHSGHYSLSHALVLGWDQSFGAGSRAGSCLTIALRVDAFWLAAPIGMLF
jgi:hypothetical protein